MNNILKEWLTAFSIGGSTGGVLSFGIGTLLHKDKLETKFQRKRSLENIEKLTTVGIVSGGFLCSTFINPIVSGVVFFAGTFPFYCSAKLNERSLRDNRKEKP